MKPTNSGAGSGADLGRKPTGGAAGESAPRTEPIMFRVRPDLATAIRRMALERGLSVQSLILLALRETGIPVLDADLEDLRGRGNGERRGAAPLRTFPVAAHHSFATSLSPGAIDDALVERLAALLMRVPASPPSQQVTITNCCCRGHPAADEAVTPNPKTMKRN
ncbi:hypothetical protein [Dongia sp.]|uniref:hypothetical protein n=1 Tax=Dongia sp. TaxID=1977262 RepID=UPI0037516197